MRVTHVIARAFGPFRGARIDLGPGLTVVAGPNESGKSSWHAALRLALIGMKRGRGRATATDTALAVQHRPWDGSDDWEVEAGLVLDDGRTIELRQDLAGKVSCSALDVGLGRDVSDEILDGTPDASRWLGLDRDTFAATLSVGQAQIMAVADAADGLQDQMQRAAATRGTEATAAEAIERLVAFRRDVVGADTVAAKGPLRLTRVRLAAATEARDVARARHADHLVEGARLEQAASQVVEARCQLDMALARRARADAIAAERRVVRATVLATAHPERPTFAARDERADLVAAAIIGWDRRPPIIALDGPSSEAIEAQLAALPDPPRGDVAPHPDVLAALHDLDVAREGLRLAEVGRPVTAAAEGPVPPHGRAREGEGWLTMAPLALFGVAALVAWLGQPMPAIATAALGAAAAVWALGRGTERRATDRANRILAARDHERMDTWEAQREEHERRERAADAALCSALAARGVEVSGDTRAAWLGYRSECETRARRAAESDRREALELRLGARRQAEAAAALSLREVDEARRGLSEAADAVGIQPTGLDPDAIQGAMKRWQHGQSAALEASRLAVEEWQELQTILGGRTLAALQDEARRLAALADQAEAGHPGTATASELGTDLDAVIEARRRALAQAEARAAEHRGSLESSARTLPDVAEAEEAVATAAAELARIESTARTIDETVRLLRQAQDRVHRDLAPILADAVRRWLPTVSAGAYVDVSVDPADLSIRAKEARSGIWREARLLSQGTREQIYLLLRVAMAEHLVTTNETAPLLLDEVTAQADGERRAALLSTLHALSAERQIILFSHDPEVADWAERTLVGPRDRLIRLPSLTRPAPGDAQLVPLSVEDAPVPEPAIAG